MEFTRLVVAHEGEDTDQWYVLEPGSVRWNEGEVLPISDGAHPDVIGYAKNVSREPNGDIMADVPSELIITMADIKVNGEPVPLVHFGVNVTAVKMIGLEDGGAEKKRVTDCLITGLGRLVQAANPGATLNKE